MVNTPTESVVHSSGNEVLPTATTTSSSFIHVTTDTVEVTIDPVGGNLIEARLLNYPESLHSQNPFLLLNNQDATKYIAQAVY